MILLSLPNPCSQKLTPEKITIIKKQTSKVKQLNIKPQRALFHSSESLYNRVIYENPSKKSIFADFSPIFLLPFLII